MRKILLSFLLFTGFQNTLLAQSPIDWLSGFQQKNDSIYFLFSEEIYQVKADGICVTGSFRNWSQDLKDTKWNLKNIGNGKWALGIYNPNYNKINPAAAFKFRTNEGLWLNPPKNAPNLDGGNLVFMLGYVPLSLEAGIENNRLIHVSIKGIQNIKIPLEINEDQVVLRDAKGVQIPLQKIVSINLPEQLELGIYPTLPIDKKRVYYIEVPSIQKKELCSFDPWFKNLKSDKLLGANIAEDGLSTSFRVFAPRATKLLLYLYTNKNQKNPDQIIELKEDSMGVWETIIPQNLNGIWYDFTVHGAADPGNSFFETNPVHVSDPYARVSDDSFGKCRVWQKTKAASPLKNGRPKMENVMAYEVHVQDFTDLLPIDSNLKGTIPAMGISGLKNSRGQAIGFDYLTQLGINTVHLMPVQEMLHWPKDEWDSAFKNDAYMIEQGVAKENYDWGYRTSHSFAIETRYRQKGTEPGTEREQFRDLVQKFHDKNIAVIVDFVFNHTAENMDGRAYLFHFNAYDKQYYYRTKNLEHIGEYGNETKSENRYMTQRWIIDQCKAFIEEFGVDGFRIDLAGQTDQQTLLLLKKELPEDIIIYGEPWIDSNDPAYNKNPEWHWYKEDAPICYFNDDTRNTYKGPVFELNKKETDRGWAGGNASLRNDVKLALTCGFPTQKNINSAINYLDIHDNFTLADQFASSGFDGRYGVDELNYKIAAVLLFTTPGPLVLHGGSEMLRSKGMAPLQEIEKAIPSGKLYFHGKRDTYNLRFANQFIWENIGKTFDKKHSPNTNVAYENADYLNMVNYWKELMELRKRYLFPLPAYQVEQTQEYQLPKNAIQFFEPKDEHMLAYIIQGKVLVVLNTGKRMEELQLVLPKGKWNLVGNANEIALDAKFAQYHESIMGGERKILIEPYSISIYIKD